MSNFSASSGGAPSVLKSASSIVAHVAGSGSHVLRIDGYSNTKGLGNSKFIASEKFAAGGHRWCLLYYPDSTLLIDSDWISVHLNLAVTNVGQVEAKYTMSLLDQNGNPVPAYSHTRRHTFKAGDSNGAGLIKKADLEYSRRYLKDDAFSVRCDVTVFKKIHTKAVKVSEVRRGVIKQER
ncbi:hypothetical protein QYE76_035693 [Lolium multiflorum]|uniref:MATH domain-containing protein n=1 Tax=Lolium multiflorum TaxID=4521 RepID=A0AAD8VP86_LOLMU|nr:hypothetical protein QYE76_035693 [Lolium multiflorum]